MPNLEHEHVQKEITRRFDKAPSQIYLQDWIYGGISMAIYHHHEIIVPQTKLITGR